MLKVIKNMFITFFVKIYFLKKLTPENLAKLDKKSIIEKTPKSSFCFINYFGYRFVGHYIYEDRRTVATLYLEDKHKIKKLSTKRKYYFNHKSL